MSKYCKFFYSEYDVTTGVSKVMLHTDLGIITGYAKVHPSDEESKSRYFGLELAEAKAYQKYLKRKIALTKSYIKGAREILCDAKYVSKGQKNKFEAMGRELIVLEDTKREIDDYIQHCKGVKLMSAKDIHEFLEDKHG